MGSGRAPLIGRATTVLMIPSMIALGLAGCGAERRAAVRSRIASGSQGLEDEPAVGAASARGEAALAREAEPVFFRGLELRARGLSADNFSRGEDVEFSARLEMNNPWALASERRARRSETDEALAEVEQTSLELRAEQCRRSMEAGALAERRAFYEWYRERLEAALEWNEQRRAAGTVDELRAQRLELEGATRLARREPPPAGDPVSPDFPLPELTAPAEPLVVQPAVVRERVGQHQPAVAGRLAAKRRLEALAERATRRRLPWFGFVEVGYELSPHNSASNITGQVALEIPFGLDQRAEARRYQALSRGEELEAEALERELSRLALAALRTISFFEGRADRLRALLQTSRASQTLADRWLAERLGEPLDVARLIDEAYQAHDSVVEERLRAGLAACLLLETTGTPLAQWPRSHVESAGQP